MKILAITAFYPPGHMGGYGLRCKDVLEGLRQKGHEILLLTNISNEFPVAVELNDPWVKRILSLKKNDKPVFKQIHLDSLELKRIQKIIYDFQPDLLYLWHMENLSDAILPFLTKQILPLVYDEGGSGLIFYARLQKRGLYFYKNEQDHVLKRFLKRLIKTFAILVSHGRIVPDWEWPGHMRAYFNSRSSLDVAHQMGVPVEGASVFPSAIEIEKFPFKERTIMGQPLKIVIPVRIKPVKGCMDGIRLVDELRRRNVRSKMLIVGDVQDLKYYDEMKKVINELDLGELVKIRDMVSREALSELYQNSDICFFPTYIKTGFSRVRLEAMASGCLVISYANEGANDAVVHGETGVTLEEGNIIGAADWIEKFINNPAKFLEMIKKARKRVTRMGSMERYITTIDAFLREQL